MSDGPRCYETHFYCALCGGPFAAVCRTAVDPARPAHAADDRNEQDQYAADDADGDQQNEFNLAEQDNCVIPDDVVFNDSNMGHAAARRRARRLRAEADGRRRGMMPETRVTWKAYDGKRISVRQLKWTKNLRALIYKRAAKHPLNYREYLGDDQVAYLSGRGLIRQNQNWADGFASIEEIEHSEDEGDEDDEEKDIHTEYPIFSEASKRNNTYGFHVYQELGRQDSDYVISAIPFHDECWTLLDLAIEESGEERGFVRMNENIEMDDLWFYLRGLVGVGGRAKAPISTSATLRGENKRDVVTRLGELDYREAQGSGEARQWKHEEGLHWLVADPSSISVLNSPLKKLSSSWEPYPQAPRAALQDPFQSLPAEMILEICNMLTSTDIFSLKTASPAVHNTILPDSYYIRFLKEEFLHLRTLSKEIETHQTAVARGGKMNDVDWRGSFERLRKLMATPQKSLSGDGSEWDIVDIGLKNRNRIWKIVKPIADDLVETSSFFLENKYHAPKINASRISVVRGYAGVRSGKEGTVESAYFGFRGKEIEKIRDPDESDEDEDTEKLEEEIRVQVNTVRIWIDADRGCVCGLGFDVWDAETGRDLRRFGRKSQLFSDFQVQRNQLAGFVFCVTDNIIGGLQLVHRNGSFSGRVGNWSGSVRKIVAPGAWRTLVGVTGFVNSSGFIETIGILEETHKHATQDRLGRLPTPPRTVDLSHEESSVWKRLPPRNVELLEREGTAMDWRLIPGEWEVWENNFYEDGAVPSGPSEPKHLCEIVGYYDETLLRGLEFIYVGYRSGRRTTWSSLMGSKQAAKRDSIKLNKPGEAMAASVICFGDAGVSGILFVTESGCASEVFGPRYLGTHKVFAPALKGKSQTVFRHETMSRIIGLHCVYDYEERRFLQLGLILPIEEDSIFDPPLPRPIPFDQVGDQLQVWDDKPPPSEWIIGEKPQDNLSLQYDLPTADYSGWVILSKPLRRITMYGQMKGIRFSFSDKSKDRFFGHVDNEQDVFVQEIDVDNGEEIIGIAVLDEDAKAFDKEDYNDDDSVGSVSSQGDHTCCRERIFFLTNRNEASTPFQIKCRITSPHLKAIKIDFDYYRLVSWAPIYAAASSDPESIKAVSEKVRFPWTSRHDKVTPDRPISLTSRVTCTFFDDDEESRPIDAVKGYVSSSGHFCGLLFRRAGLWEKDVFGERSAYELTMELHPGESFTALYLTFSKGEMYDKSQKIQSLAICTNHGRITPWFGKLAGGSTKLREPPTGKVVVGIYATLENIPYFAESIAWNTIGLLCKDDTSAPQQVVPRPQPPSCSGFHIKDPATGLPWLNDYKARLRTLAFTPLVAGRSSLYLNEQSNRCIGRSYVVFEPSELEQIRVFMNSANRPGIRSFRFRGTKRMGMTTMGSWHNREDVRLKRHQKMTISGRKGERITRIKIALQRREHEDRVVGITVETNYSREKTMVSSEMFPEKPIDLTADNVKILECLDNEKEEIVGLHGIISSYNIHDIGLVIRKKIHSPPPRPKRRYYDNETTISTTTTTNNNSAASSSARKEFEAYGNN